MLIVITILGLVVLMLLAVAAGIWIVTSCNGFDYIIWGQDALFGCMKLFGLCIVAILQMFVDGSGS